MLGTRGCQYLPNYHRDILSCAAVSFCIGLNLSNNHTPSSVFWKGLWFLGNPKDMKNWSSKNTKIPRGSKITRKSQRFNKFIVPKYQDSTRIQHYEKWSILFQKYSWVSRIYLCFEDFEISKIYQDSTILFSVFYLKRSEIQNVLCPPNVGTHT